jgi:intracellular sulfur oxidation DsrE/DsrF family protein
MRLVDVKKEHVMPELTIVENSWVTLIGYQARGYAYIAP